MRKTIREVTEIIYAALNRLDELEEAKRLLDPAELKPISKLLTRARGYLIEEERKEAS